MPTSALVQPVIHPDDAALYQAAVAGLELLPPVPGGATRQASVRAGLEALRRAAPTSCWCTTRRGRSRPRR